MCPPPPSHPSFPTVTTTMASDLTYSLPVIRKFAGRDATATYSEVHPPSLLHREGSVTMVGKLDPATPKSWSASTGAPTQDQPASDPAATIPGDKPLVPKPKKPELETLINYHDFESAAQSSLTAKTWAFYSSAATDCVTHRLNSSLYNRILLRPRVMRDMTLVDTSTTILGRKSTLPFFCAPAALARMAHPDGECAIARSCARQGIPQGISTSASYPVEDIVESVMLDKKLPHPENVPMSFFYQLYVDRDRKKSEVLLRKVEELGLKGIMVTVDAATNGKRELDERVSVEQAMKTAPARTPGEAFKKDKQGGGLARLMSGFIDPALIWNDIKWLRKSTKLPLVLKGIMTWQDAVLAAEAGVEGIILSNHGGRNLDTSPPSLLTLLEIQRNAPWVFDKLEIIVDGGIKRGTDIFKALCLGASSVEIGRGFLYAVNYGEEGVERFIGILRDELETTMRLMGVNSLNELHPGMVNTQDIDHLVSVGDKHPYAKGIAKARL